ncbi:MAG: type II toxin-antitoxin system death-on-curing family toxin [Cellulomonadaceae bacterium]
MRDLGLLQAALARPQATFDGTDLYPTLELKAAALMHSIAGNHALVDGNKRLALAATIVFLGVNGRRLTWTNDEAYEVTVVVAAGALDSVPEIAARISAGMA